SRLHAFGVKIAIDDFGTGYSSLTYLMSLDVDTLKIDRSFVMGMTDTPRKSSLVRSIIDIAHTFDLEVVAEGVEAIAEWEQLSADGCDLAQGYLIAKPVEPAAIVQLARAASASRAALPA